MNCGNLSCPKCGELRMDNFDHWESRINAYGQIQWLFYRTIVIKNGWRCWALLTSCSKKLPKSWYDPCGLCFNPCRYDGPRTVTVRRDMFGNEQVVSDDLCCCCIVVGFKCIFLYMLCYLTYFFYFSIFIWYDIYYCIFKETVFYDVYTPNGNVKIRENDEVGKWQNIPNEGLTEQYWHAYGVNIFRCNKCGFISNSFHDFIESERNERNKVIIHDNNNIENEENNNNDFNAINIPNGKNSEREVIIHNNIENVENNNNLNAINVPPGNNLQGEVIEVNNLPEEVIEDNNLQGESKEVNYLQGETLEADNLNVEVIEVNNLQKENVGANNLQKGNVEVNNFQKENVEANNLPKENVEVNNLKREAIEVNNLQGEDRKSNNLEGETIEANTLQGETVEVNNLHLEVVETNNLKGEVTEVNNLQKENVEANNLQKENVETNNLQGETIEAISVHFISEDKSINQFIQSSSEELFSNVLEKFFGIYPDLKNKICIFIYNGKGMKPNLTLEKNNYKSGDEILIMIRG